MRKLPDRKIILFAFYCICASPFWVYAIQYYTKPAAASVAVSARLLDPTPIGTPTNFTRLP